MENGNLESPLTISESDSFKVPKMGSVITENLLQSIIDEFHPSAKLISYGSAPGCEVGESFMSILYAIDMILELPCDNGDCDDEKKTVKLNVIVKTIPMDPSRAKMMNGMNAFAKEAFTYQQIFPEFIRFQLEKGVPPSLLFQSWPKFYAAHVDGVSDFLAMENLKYQRYKMGDRKIGLDFSHSALVLQELARYHAISYAKFGGSKKAILESFPVAKGWQFGRGEDAAKLQRQYFAESFKCQAEALRETGEELAASRLEKLSKADILSQLENLLENGVKTAVVAHGDCWISNVLFGYAEDDLTSSFPTHMKFIDFQVSSSTSRLVDIYYFLLTSLKLDVLEKHEDDLLRIYYSEFTNFSMKLGIDIHSKGLTWNAFVEEANRYRFYGVCTSLYLSPWFMAEVSDLPDMDAFFKGESEQNPWKVLLKENVLQKIKFIVLEQLPKCTGMDRYL